MIRNVQKLVLIGLCIGCISTNASGSLKKVGTSGFTFLEIPVSARQEGLGEASIGLAGMGSDAVFSNPALLPAVPQFAVGLSHAQYIADIVHQGVSMAFHHPTLGAFGIGFIRLSMDDMQGTVNDPTMAEGYRLTNKFSNGAYAIGATYARQLTDRFALGATLKYVREGADNIELVDGSVHNFKASNVLVDMGTLYVTGLHSLRLATSVQSYGMETEYVGDVFKMPSMFRIGAAMDFATPGNEHVLTVLVEALHPSDYTERIVVGAEYWLWNTIALRGGYRFNTDQKKYSLGSGVRFRTNEHTMTLDISYTDFGVLENIIRFSLGYEY